MPDLNAFFTRNGLARPRESPVSPLTQDSAMTFPDADTRFPVTLPDGQIHKGAVFLWRPLSVAPSFCRPPSTIPAGRSAPVPMPGPTRRPGTGPFPSPPSTASTWGGRRRAHPALFDRGGQPGPRPAPAVRTRRDPPPDRDRVVDMVHRTHPQAPGRNLRWRPGRAGSGDAGRRCKERPAGA